MKTSISVLFLTVIGSFTILLAKPRAEGTKPPQPIPQPQTDESLAPSPFTRPLNRPGTLVLTGFAIVGSQPIATVFDRDSERSMVISNTPNDLGMKLVEIQGARDPEAAIAIIEIENGETLQAHTATALLKQAGKHPRPEDGTGTQQLAVLDATKLVPDWILDLEDPVMKGDLLRGLIEGGAFDNSPFKAVDMALTVSEPQARQPALSAAFAKLGGGVGGTEKSSAVARLNTLPVGRDRDFALNGLAHGLARRDPQGALKWANSISQEGFRKVVVKNVTRRIEGQASQSRKR